MKIMPCAPFALLAVWALICLSCAAACAKSGFTYYSPEEREGIRGRAKSPHFAAEVADLLKKADRLAALTDQQIWDLIPDADLPRALNVRFGEGCPVHGQEIFKKGGHYPWIMSPDRPFKVECPIGHEVYPSNDFEAHLRSGRTVKLDTSQKYVDDGSGWLDENGNRYWFVGHYVFWELWRHTILDGLNACANAYIVTGDEKYAHTAGVVLARLTQVYPEMDYSNQAYHNGRWPAQINGRILDYIWENSTVTTFAIAYDAAWEALAEDQALVQFAAEKGVPNIREAVEQNLLQVAARDILAKKIWGNKFELGSLSTIALALDNRDESEGLTSREIVDWILRGEGELEFTFYNGFDRDGIGGESSPSYSLIWNTRMIEAAENLARLGVDLVQDPKWLRLARGPSEMRLLNTLSPRIGDCGGDIMGAPQVVRGSLARFGVQHFEDAFCAKLLLRDAHPEGGLLDRSTVDLETIRSLAEEDSFPDAPYTRDMGGYGLAILEQNDGRETRSASLYYGSSGASHGHKDALTIFYQMRERDLLTDLGYPSHWGPVADYWIKNTPSHYAVTIDTKPQQNRMAGFLREFVDLGDLQYAEADALPVWNGLAADYTRGLALLKVAEGSAVLIDTYAVAGGSQHDYIFHGLPYGEFSLNGKLLRHQETGTLAGETVAYAQNPGDGSEGNGYQFFREPRWHSPEDVTLLRWRGDQSLNMDAWFPAISHDEVIVADAIPPIKPGYPAFIPYVLLRGTAEGVNSSLFLGIVDVWEKRTPLQSVERIASDTAQAGGAVLRMRDGSLWRIYVNHSGGRAEFEDGTASVVRLAAVRVSQDRVTKGFAVGSGSLQMQNGYALQSPEPTVLAVRNVDYARNQVRLAGRPPESITGRVAFAETADHSASWTIASASPLLEDTKVGFGGIGLITGRFRGEWDAEARLLRASERTAGVYNQFIARSFLGMTAVNDDMSEAATITGYDAAAGTWALDLPDERAARFCDQNGDGISYIYISDIGPDSSFRFTSAVADQPAQE